MCQIPVNSISFKLFRSFKILNKLHKMQLQLKHRFDVGSSVLFCFLDKQLYLNVHFVSGSDNRKKKQSWLGLVVRQLCI